MAIQYRKHTPTGDIYAVDTDDLTGEILGLCGPIEADWATSGNLARRSSFGFIDDPRIVSEHTADFTVLTAPFPGDRADAGFQQWATAASLAGISVPAPPRAFDPDARYAWGDEPPED